VTYEEVLSECHVRDITPVDWQRLDAGVGGPGEDFEHIVTASKEPQAIDVEQHRTSETYSHTQQCRACDRHSK